MTAIKNPKPSDLAAAGALGWSRPLGEVRSIRVDGQTVDLSKARALLAANKTKTPVALDRWLDAIQARADGVAKKLGTGAVAGSVASLVAGDAEQVRRTVNVEVEFADGRTEALALDVTDRTTSMRLNLAVALLEVVSLVPLVGGALTFGLAGTTKGLAVRAEKTDRPYLAQAFEKASLKQWVLLGLGFAPGVGSVSAIIAAVKDLKDFRALASAPPMSLVGEPRRDTGPSDVSTAKVA